MLNVSNTGRAGMVLTCAAVIGMLAFPVNGVRADYNRAKQWFEAQSPANRIALQGALFWSGEYFGPIDARFGPQTYASLISYQKRSGAVPTGVLGASEQDHLQREALRIRKLVYRFTRRQGTTAAPELRSRGFTSASSIFILP